MKVGCPKRIGPAPVCLADGCNNLAKGRRYCDKHLYRLRTHGTLLKPSKKKAPPPVCKVDGCNRLATTTGLCGMHYSRVLRHKHPELLITQRGEPEAWLRRLLSGSLPDHCVGWPFGHFPAGYGVLRYRGRNRHAHAVAWEISSGSVVPHGLGVLHSCDNRNCVNPRHLRMGSQKENMQDAVLRKRIVVNRQAKLSPEQVLQIRCDTRETRLIAKEYGVSGTHIRRIMTRKAWPLI